jgi:hypothetical protein
VSQSPNPAERRRSPRVKAVSLLHGYWVELDMPVRVLDISLGGFAVESPIPFPTGSEQTFLFSTGDGRETLVRCQCRNVRTAEANGATISVAGFQFLPQPEEDLRVVIEAVRRLL